MHHRRESARSNPADSPIRPTPSGVGTCVLAYERLASDDSEFVGSCLMVVEHRNRRRWLETAIIFAAWTIFGLLLANQNYIQTALRGRQMPLVVALRPGL